MDPRLAHLSPSHHHFVWVPDPWHYQSFVENAAVVNAISEGRVHQVPGTDGIRGGPCMKIWYSADRDGKLIGEWGHDVPDSVQVCKKCNSPNTNGSPIWCPYCGLPYPQ